MNHSPYANNWLPCVKLIALSDKIGQLDPTCHKHLMLRSDYEVIEMSIYNRYKKYYAFTKGIRNDTWIKTVRFLNKTYKFTFDIVANKKCCNITFVME